MESSHKMFDVACILFGEWREKIESDGIFENEKDARNWVINEENLTEVLEILQLEGYFEDNEAIESLLKKDGRTEVNFHDFSHELKEILMDQKKVSLTALVNSDDFVLPADRINKFLKTLIKDFK